MVPLVLVASLFSAAEARRTGLPGDPDDDGCTAEGLRAALEEEPFDAFVEAVAAACPGFEQRITPWMRARVEGVRAPVASKACSRAKGDLKRAVSPGFEARMKGVDKACKLRGWPVTQAVGPSALLLGYVVSERLVDAGHDPELAKQVGYRLAGIEGGRLDGRYGSFARAADAVVLPTAERIRTPLPVAETPMFADQDASSTEAIPEGPGWLAILPPSGTLGEEAPIHGVQLVKPRPAALQLTVSPTTLTLSYGAAGEVVEAGRDIDGAVSEARERLSAAQEFGADGLFHGSGPAGAGHEGSSALPDHVWVEPVEDVTVQRVVTVLDALFEPDGTPRFDEVSIATGSSLVEWPERVD